MTQTQVTSYPATAMKDVIAVLHTALNRIVSLDEGADLHGRTVEELLVNAVRWHPEPDVANYAQHEIRRLFTDFPVKNDA